MKLVSELLFWFHSNDEVFGESNTMKGVCGKSPLSIQLNADPMH